MKNIIALLLTFSLSFSFSQKTKKFTQLILLESTPLKNQQSSGTCWSFATTSFIETEAIRLGKDPIVLSPMFFVTPTYLQKAEKYVETKGKTWMDAGDLTFSVLNAYQNYGAIPEEIYTGRIKDDWQHDHVEMDNLIEAMMSSVATSGYGRIKPNSWRNALQGTLEAYLGKIPSEFTYKGKNYTPKTFADKFIGISPSDYIEITSYTHIPFYKKSILNIPANWGHNTYMNLPINDFESVIENALKSGFSLAWDGDASEPNFKFDKGIAVLDKNDEDITISQELRQKTFEDKSTTDDHNMHLIGKAKDNKGKIFYILKNSEGNNEQGGFVYMSKNALLLKTISLLVHKDAIPVNIKSKL